MKAPKSLGLNITGYIFKIRSSEELWLSNSLKIRADTPCHEHFLSKLTGSDTHHFCSYFFSHLHMAVSKFKWVGKCNSTKYPEGELEYL